MERGEGEEEGERKRERGSSKTISGGRNDKRSSSRSNSVTMFQPNVEKTTQHWPRVRPIRRETSKRLKERLGSTESPLTWLAPVLLESRVRDTTQKRRSRALDLM